MIYMWTRWTERKINSELRVQVEQRKEINTNKENKVLHKSNKFWIFYFLLIYFFCYQIYILSNLQFFCILFTEETTLEEYLTPMNRKLDLILAIFNDQNLTAPTNIFDLLPNFPLDSIENFKLFCNELHNNEDIRKQFVSYNKLFYAIGACKMTFSAHYGILERAFFPDTDRIKNRNQHVRVENRSIVRIVTFGFARQTFVLSGDFRSPALVS